MSNPRTLIAVSLICVGLFLSDFPLVVKLFPLILVLLYLLCYVVLLSVSLLVIGKEYRIKV
jgi:hypothetical protein